jgi:hypothetical protein
VFASSRLLAGFKDCTPKNVRAIYYRFCAAQALASLADELLGLDNSFLNDGDAGGSKLPLTLSAAREARGKPEPQERKPRTVPSSNFEFPFSFSSQRRQ